MAISQRLKDYLDSRHAHYQVLYHEAAYTAPAVAHALHVPGKELAKVVILKVDEKFVMTVLPSTWSVDLSRLRAVLQGNEVRLATEEEIGALFPDCEIGSMSPFGNLYGLQVYVDQSLAQDEEIVFQGGTTHEAVRMRYQDFAALARPTVEQFHQPTLNMGF